MDFKANALKGGNTEYVERWKLMEQIKIGMPETRNFRWPSVATAMDLSEGILTRVRNEFK